MTRFLLDINVLIALNVSWIDQHDRAHEWFASKGQKGPDDVSLLERQHVDKARLLDSAHVADSYLLALARSHNGQLASFDKRLVTDAVMDGSRTLSLIH